MIAKLHLFFKSRYYRRMCLLSIGTSIIHWIKTPFLCIKAVYNVIRIYIENPNSWDRYLKFKEIEHNNKIEQEREQTAILHMNLIGEIFNFSICALEHCSYSEANDVTEADYKTVQDEFNETKQNIKNLIQKLEKRNVAIPSELKATVESADISSFTNLNECQEFHQRLNSLLDEIINVT